MLGHRALVIIAVFVGVATPTFAASQEMVLERQELTLPSGVNPYDCYTLEVALDGPWLFVGCPYDDTDVSNGGAIFVFHRDAGTWSFAEKLTPDGRVEDVRLGIGLDAQDGVLVAGAYGRTPLSGYFQVFEHQESGWGPTQRFYPPTGVASPDGFGTRVAVSPPWLMASATLQWPFGAVYEFMLDDEWTAAGQLEADGAAMGDTFGSAMGISGNHMVIGASNNRDVLEWNGAIFFFELTDGVWRTADRFLPPVPERSHLFGAFADIDGDVAVASSYWSRQFGQCDMVIYGRRDGYWSAEAHFSMLDPSADLVMEKCPVATAGGIVAFGQPMLPALQRVGEVQLYRQSDAQWVEHAHLEEPLTLRSFYGDALAMDGEWLVVPAPGDGADGAQTLRIFAYRIAMPPTGASVSPNIFTLGSAPGTTIGTLTGIDPNQDDTHTFELASDMNGAFVLAGDQLVVASPEVITETTTSISLRVTATDSTGLSGTGNVNIVVEVQPEPSPESSDDLAVFDTEVAEEAAADASPPAGDGDAGCSCQTRGHSSEPPLMLLASFVGLAMLWRRE